MLPSLNLALAFLLEIGVLAALGYWGFNTGQTPFTRILLGIGAPVLAIAIWAVWGAPKSSRRLRGAGLLALRIIFFFGGGALVLIAAGQTTAGIIFAVVSAINLTLIYVWKQDLLHD